MHAMQQPLKQQQHVCSSARAPTTSGRTPTKRAHHHPHSSRNNQQQNPQQQHQAALLYDFHDQLIPYEQAWSWQKQRVAELCTADTQDRRDTVFLLQHPPVYTLGAGSSEAHVKFNLQQPPHPLFRTERGGEVTYHGPGQLVLYPILDLNRHTQDLHWYLRALEEVVIRALAATSGLQGERVPGLTGVWVGGHKLAAIGVRARKWVTYHGLALNVTTDLQPFSHITPCGIADRPVGSVSTALGRHQQQQQQQQAQRHGSPASHGGSIGDSSSSSSADGGGDGSSGNGSGSGSSHADLQAVVSDPLVIEYRYALLEAMEEVFGLQLQPASAQQMQELLQQNVLQVSSAEAGGKGGKVGAPAAAAGVHL